MALWSKKKTAKLWYDRRWAELTEEGGICICNAYSGCLHVLFMMRYVHHKSITCYPFPTPGCARQQLHRERRACALPWSPTDTTTTTTGSRSKPTSARKQPSTATGCKPQPGSRTQPQPGPRAQPHPRTRPPPHPGARGRAHPRSTAAPEAGTV